MDNKIENKLVIIAGPGCGQEFYLLQARTTIGSAPGNDVRLDSQDVSGFHAEFRIENNVFLISDFSSEKGTYVNEERVEKDKQVAAGDIIQIGSTPTVFLPPNAILDKENSRRKNSQSAPPKSCTPTYKKWFIIACVFLVMISAIKMAFGIGKNRKAHRGEATARENQIVGAAHSAKDNNGVKNEQQDSPGGSRENVNMPPNQTPTELLDTSAENRQKKSGFRQPDNIASIHFNIAKKFADYQLWQDALEHYRRVLEKIPDYPELSAQIAKMQLEISNQTAYRQGQALIQKGSYEEGIASMENIDENSFYYDEAVKAIADAKEKMAQTIKRKQ